jgi:hypothetical protein
VLDHFGWVRSTEHPSGIGPIVGGLLMMAAFCLITRF